MFQKALVPQDKGVANLGFGTRVARTRRQSSLEIAHADRRLAIAIEMQDADSQCHVDCPQRQQ